jgi:hypothetical protein
MSKRITIICLFTIFLTAAKAQEKMTIVEVDQKTFQLFQEKKWSELIQYSDEARKQGIDFFYLQVRTGIAWYNQGKYRNAASRFLKAYETDQSFDWLQEYVYYSLIFSGRELEAYKYFPSFSTAEQAKIGIRKNALTHLGYEFGYSSNPDFESLKTRDFSTETNLGEDYGEGYFLKDYSFNSLDVSHRLGQNLTINHNLTYYSANREAIVDWGGQTSSPIKINQFNYYINPVWIIGKKLNISPSLNLIFGKGDLYAGGLTVNSEKKYTLSKSTYNDAVFSTAAWSDFGNFSPGLEVNAASINDSKFIQLSSWISWYPLSNSKLYITPKVYYKGVSGGKGFGWNALSISGGARLGKVFVSGQYLFGDMENFIEADGYLISNFAGTSDRKIMGSLYFPTGKKYQFFMRYISQNITEKYQVYTGGFKSTSMDYNYIKQTITAGISWNF